MSAPSTSQKHSWLIEDRIVLALLWKLYSNPREELLMLWNSVQGVSATSERLHTNGLSMRSMIAQINEMKRGGTGSVHWNSVDRIPISQVRQIYRNERDKIEDAAQDLGVVLSLRIEDPPKLLLARPLSNHGGKRALVAREEDWLVSPSPSIFDDAEIHEKVSPCKRRKLILDAVLVSTSTTEVIAASTPNHRCPSTPVRRWDEISLDFENGPSNHENTPLNLENIRPSPKLRVKDSQRNHNRFRPRLLFRAFQPAHLFRARKFVAITTSVPKPPPFSSAEFGNLVRPHLMTDLSYSSPFISLAQSPKNALNRVKKSPQLLSFAVFDIIELENDIEERYGRDCGPYLVPEICRVHKLHDLPRGYHGPGEFLVWGSINCGAAAMFNKQDAMELIRVMETMNAVDRGSGMKLGNCLRHVVDKYKEFIARKLLNAFKIPGYERGYRNISYCHFAEGLYSVSGDNRATSVGSVVAIQIRNPTVAAVDQEEETDDMHEHEQDFVNNQLAGDHSQRNIHVKRGSKSLRQAHNKLLPLSSHNTSIAYSRAQQTCQTSSDGVQNQIVDLTTESEELIAG